LPKDSDRDRDRRATPLDPEKPRQVILSDQTAKVWEAATGQELLTLSGHIGTIWSVAPSPDGQWIATVGDDPTAKVWPAARTEQIDAWQKEERTSAQSRAILLLDRATEQEPERLARARDEGAIKQWLILAPIPIAPGQSGPEALETQQIEGEAHLRPKAGEEAVLASGERRWQESAHEDYVIDFNVVLGDLTQQSVVYAVCYIQSEIELGGLQMLVGSDDEAKVYLNGRLIHKSPVGRGFLVDRDTVPNVALNAGLNVLVFKVVNEFVEWKGSVRFTDAAGHPVRGIRVTLDPDVKDSR
jgi:hypothetical protein